jgi:hypothetical protein
MKRQRLQLPGQMSVEACRDSNGIFYVVYGNGASVLRSCPKGVRKALRLPVGTASRAMLDAWLDELQAPDPAPAEPQNSALDPSDPNYQTKTVI